MQKIITRVILLWISILSYPAFSHAQTADTVLLTPGMLKINQLPLGAHKYLVYFKKSKDSSANGFQMWNLDIKKEKYGKKNALIVNQVWEDNLEVIHRVSSVNDIKDFHPLYQKSWWKPIGTLETDFENKTATFPDQMFRKNVDSLKKVSLDNFHTATQQYSLNWHLDMEVFSMLPFKTGRTFGINFYESGSSAPKLQYYYVRGDGFLNDYNGSKVDCWLLVHQTPGNKETFWISKENFEVLKLEQIAGSFYRYKVKLVL